MADTQIVAGGVSAAPLAYTVPGAQEIILKSLFATFDGTASAGAFLPCVRIIAPGGKVVGEYVADATVSSGSSAEVSFAPFLRGSSGTATVAGTASYAAVHMSQGTPPTADFPLALTDFVTSDTATFATSTHAAPVTVSNTSGDTFLLLQSTGVYYVQFYGFFPAAAGVERAARISAFGNLLDIYTNGGLYGLLDPHADAVESYTSQALVFGGGEYLTLADRMMAAVDASLGPGYIGFGFHPRGGAVITGSVYAAVYYWPSGTGTVIY